MRWDSTYRNVLHPDPPLVIGKPIHPPTHRTLETHWPNPTHSITSILQLVRYVVLDLLA